MIPSLRAVVAVAVLSSSVLAARPALAQEASLPTQTMVEATLPMPNYLLMRPEVKAAEQTGVSSVSPLSPRVVNRASSSAAWKGVLAGLDSMTIGAQLADFDSTLKVMKVGGVESNPLLSGLVNNRNAFLGVKLGIAAGLVYATHNMAHRNKIAAVVAAVASNSVYAYISQRNYKLARGAASVAR